MLINGVPLPYSVQGHLRSFSTLLKMTSNWKTAKHRAKQIEIWGSGTVDKIRLYCWQSQDLDLHSHSM